MRYAYLAVAIALALICPATASAVTARASTYGGHGEYQDTRLGRTDYLARHRIYYVAHRTMPIGTLIDIRYKGRTRRAVVADRGPAKWTGKSLDLGHNTANALRFSGSGTVSYRVVGRLPRSRWTKYWCKNAMN